MRLTSSPRPWAGSSRHAAGRPSEGVLSSHSRTRSTDRGGSMRKLAGPMAAAVLLLAACSGEEPKTAAGSKGTVNLDIHAWVGYEAQAAVLAYLLERELGYKVNLRKMKEDDSWRDFADGKVDVIVENWGHPH